jgi:hypothetical protein
MFENVNFNVNEGDIVVLQARSGTGCVASVPVFSVLMIFFIFTLVTSRVSRPQKDYPLEVHSSSLSLSWKCRIPGKVSRSFLPHICVSRQCRMASEPPKLMVSLPSKGTQ